MDISESYENKNIDIGYDEHDRDNRDDRDDNEIYEYEELLTNLKLLSQVKEDDKLMADYGNQYSIDTRYYFQSVRRWIFGDSKDLTCGFIKNIIKSINFHSNDLIEKIDKNNKNKVDDILKLNNLTSDMISCRNGLENLKITYRKSPIFRSKIDIFIDQFRIRIEKNFDYSRKY